MTTVRNILEAKGNAVWSISPDATILDAIKLMAEKNVGALLVRTSNDIAGIISERDYARKVALKGISSHNSLVQHVMTTNVVTVRLEDSIESCMELMTAKHVRHLPVVDEGRLTGMVSIGDIVKALLSDKEQTIEQLQNYITGKR